MVGGLGEDQRHVRRLRVVGGDGSRENSTKRVLLQHRDRWVFVSRGILSRQSQL